MKRQKIPTFLIVLLMVTSSFLIIVPNINLVHASTTAFSSGFEDGKWNSTTYWNSATYWERGNSTYPGSPWAPHAGSNMSYASPTDDSNLDTVNINVAGAASMNVSFWYMNDDSEGSDLTFYYYNGTAWNLQSTDLGITDPEDTWLFYRENITAAQYLISTFRIRFTAAEDSNEGGFIDDVLVVYDLPAAKDVTFTNRDTALKPSGANTKGIEKSSSLTGLDLILSLLTKGVERIYTSSSIDISSGTNTKGNEKGFTLSSNISILSLVSTVFQSGGLEITNTLSNIVVTLGNLLSGNERGRTIKDLQIVSSINTKTMEKNFVYSSITQFIGLTQNTKETSYTQINIVQVSELITKQMENLFNFITLSTVSEEHSSGSERQGTVSDTISSQETKTSGNELLFSPNNIVNTLSLFTSTFQTSMKYAYTFVVSSITEITSRLINGGSERGFIVKSLTKISSVAMMSAKEITFSLRGIVREVSKMIGLAQRITITDITPTESPTEQPSIGNLYGIILVLITFIVGIAGFFMIRQRKGGLKQ